ncbi:hypothetical protein DRJ25_05870, partial [Candidatus Woesearchaeota archaeon]
KGEIYTIGSADDFVITIGTDIGKWRRYSTNTIYNPKYKEFLVEAGGFWPSNYAYNYDIDCDSDGIDEATGVTGSYLCQYDKFGIYTIRIKDANGDGTGFPGFQGRISGEDILSIDQWGTGKWRIMQNMFLGAKEMQGKATDIPDLSQVTDMMYMFTVPSGEYERPSFSQDIGDWDTSNITMMRGTFYGNAATGLGIGAWDTSNVTNMDCLFCGAPVQVKHDLSGWNVSSLQSAKDMFAQTALSTTNYDALLISWSEQSLQNNVTFDAGNSKYCAGESAREKMINLYGWTITDGGKTDSCLPSAPEVSSITRTDDNPTAEPSVDFTVNFSQNVDNVDPTDFEITTTGSISGSSVTGISGVGDIYVVSVTTGSGIGTIRLDLKSSGTNIQNAAEVPINGGYTDGEEYNFSEDTTPPTASDILRKDNNPTNATSVEFTVTFSEDVNGVDIADFTLIPSGGITGASLLTSTGSGNTYTISANTGTGNGTIRLDLKSSGTNIQDLTGNPLSGGFTSGEVYEIDKTVPTVSISSTASDPTTTSPIPVTITFSENVTGFVVDDITVGNGTTSNFSGSDTTYTVDITPAHGEVSVDVAGAVAQDNVGNENTAAPQFTIEYQDKTAPTILSINRKDGNPTSASSVEFTLTFDESVTGVDTSAPFDDFALIITGEIADTSISAVADTGDHISYTVTVDIGTGNGTLRLDVNSSGTGIQDAAGNPLSGGFTSGEVYTIEKSNNYIEFATDIINQTSYRNEISTLDATSSDSDPDLSSHDCGISGKGQATVWYKYYLIDDDAISFDTIGSGYDTFIVIWALDDGDSAPADLKFVACNDDTGGTKQSAVAIRVTGDKTYYIEVGQP